MYINSPHALVLQSCVFETTPVQFAPPLLGTGFVHVRVEVCLPPPQTLLHTPHLLQFDRPPSTAVEIIKELDVSDQNPQTRYHMGFC